MKFSSISHRYHSDLFTAVPCNESPTDGRNARLYKPIRGQFEFGYGDIVLFFCNVGYVVEGTNKIRDETRCQADGTWERMPIHCESEWEVCQFGHPLSSLCDQ